jgi:hypothetical protein
VGLVFRHEDVIWRIVSYDAKSGWWNVASPEGINPCGQTHEKQIRNSTWIRIDPPTPATPPAAPKPTRTLAELEQAWLDARRAWVSCDNHMEPSSAVAWHRMNEAAAALAQAEEAK